MEKNRISSLVEKNSLVDEGNGFIRVKGGLTLTDESEQHNGTRYDVKTLSLDDYDNTLFADHGDEWGGYSIEKVIGKLVGVSKRGKRLVADGIQYAVNASPLANFAYQMTREGYLDSFSIGTTGEQPSPDGVFHNHSVFEISQVGIPNNKNAKINEIALNSIEQAKQNGLDTSELEHALHLNDKTEETKTEETVEEVEDKKDEVVEETNNKETDMSKTEDTTVEAPEKKLEMTDEFKNALQEAIKPFAEKIDNLEKNAFDKEVKEPDFKQTNSKPKGNVASDWRDRSQQQVNAFITQDRALLTELNTFNYEELKKEGKVRNAMSIDSFGNFVACPEMLTEIEGCRNDYQTFTDRFTWTETTSLQTSWLERVGDINSQPVALCGENKPVSEYAATPRTANMELFAALTPVCNSATRFLVADILGDIAEGYRNDYDRKRAELAVARMEQAVDSNGNSITWPVTDESDVERLQTVIQLISALCTCTPNGVLIMSCATKAVIDSVLVASGLGNNLAYDVIAGNGLPRLFGHEYILVPNDILPDISVPNDTRTFVVEGENVTVQHAVFYTNLNNFTGRTSGGLIYQLFDQATYHSGSNVLSAVERNEIVIRGEHYRNGFIKNSSQVSGLINGTNTSS